jgi:hypothetical protein
VQQASAAAIRRGLRLTSWTARDLWVAAAGIGGDLRPRDVDDIATGRQPATSVQHDILAIALNEHLEAWGEHHPVPYWRDLSPHRP